MSDNNDIEYDEWFDDDDSEFSDEGSIASLIDVDDESFDIEPDKTNYVQGVPESTQDLMNSVWGISGATALEVKKAASLYSMKHGMFASVPILCKADNCAFKNVCTVNAFNRIEGQRCPMEAGAIISRFESYCTHFEVGLQDEVKPSEEVDLTLIRELVNIEVMILRAENKIAIDGDFLGDTIAHVSKKDDVYYEKTITPTAEFQMKLSDQRQKLLRLLNSTRKDKANEQQLNDPSVKASILMEKMAMLKEESKSTGGNSLLDVIDVDLTPDDLVNEDGSINFDILDEINDKISQKGE